MTVPRWFLTRMMPVFWMSRGGYILAVELLEVQNGHDGAHVPVFRHNGVAESQAVVGAADAEGGANAGLGLGAEQVKVEDLLVKVLQGRAAVVVEDLVSCLVEEVHPGHDGGLIQHVGQHVFLQGERVPGLVVVRQLPDEARGAD